MESCTDSHQHHLLLRPIYKSILGDFRLHIRLQSRASPTFAVKTSSSALLAAKNGSFKVAPAPYETPSGLDRYASWVSLEGSSERAPNGDRVKPKNRRENGWDEERDGSGDMNRI